MPCGFDFLGIPGFFCFLYFIYFRLFFCLMQSMTFPGLVFLFENRPKGGDNTRCAESVLTLIGGRSDAIRCRP